MYPTINELNSAANKMLYDICVGWSTKSIAVISPAPEIIGIASKNENFAASLGFKPSNVPIIIVMPDREIPGIIANAWDKPINKLLFILIDDLFVFILFDKNRINPVKIKETDTSLIDSKNSEIYVLAPNPIIAAGIVPITK